MSKPSKYDRGREWRSLRDVRLARRRLHTWGSYVRLPDTSGLGCSPLRFGYMGQVRARLLVSRACFSYPCLLLRFVAKTRSPYVSSVEVATGSSFVPLPFVSNAVPEFLQVGTVSSVDECGLASHTRLIIFCFGCPLEFVRHQYTVSPLL